MSRYVLISGSVAFDTIMVFDGYFKDHILPERVHQINVSMLTPQLKRESGGCAANIAYNLTLLGGHPAIVAAVGADGAGYVEQLKKRGIDTRQLLVLPEYFTPQAFITTDMAANQIAAFHPGAMNEAHRARIDAFPASDVSWGIVSPDGKQAMVEHAQQFADAKIPFIFDPGQGMPLFNGDELKAIVKQATALTLNDYEFGMLCNKTGWTEAEAAEAAGTMIVTLGGDGSRLYQAGQIETIKPTPISQAVDPTGCGDAYRAGLLYGLSQGWDWGKSARMGSIMGAIKIEAAGPQNHHPSRDDIADRFAAAYGSRPHDNLAVTQRPPRSASTTVGSTSTSTTWITRSATSGVRSNCPTIGSTRRKGFSSGAVSAASGHANGACGLISDSTAEAMISSMARYSAQRTAHSTPSSTT